MCPPVDPAGMLAAAFCATDGHLTPEAVVAGYAFAARGLGAHIETRCEVTGLEPGRGAHRPRRHRGPGA